MFRKAVKRDAKLRLALSGPAGSGKTYSLLAIATEQAPKPASASRAVRGMALESAQAGGRGAKRMRNAEELAAPGESVVRVFLQRTEWKSKAQQVLEKNVRARKLATLYVLQDRMRILTGRIEALEDELDLLGWKPRVASQGRYKTPYREELVNELCALSHKERAERIRDLAAQEGIDRRSVYRKLQKCARWSLRRREDPALESKSDVVLNGRAALSDVG
jgi:transcriptional regulator of acetoin/glycerol metabolism